MNTLNRLRTKLRHLRQSTTSYSQEGEDCVIQRFFEGQNKGFYVDVGAHHPKRFSNTYMFYKKGWNGINIDAMPGSMKLFKLIRPRDINIECPIAEIEKEITYYMFNEPALNGFSEEISLSRDNHKAYKIIDKIKLKTQPLKTILAQHTSNTTGIDFLSVDVEGLDFEVLKSNDWELYRPRLVLAEILNSDLEDLRNEEIYKFMVSKGYKVVSKTFNTCFFERT